MTTPVNSRTSVPLNILLSCFTKVQFTGYRMLFKIQVSRLKMVYVKLSDLHKSIYTNHFEILTSMIGA